MLEIQPEADQSAADQENRRVNPTRIHHQILTLLVQWEGDDLADRRLAGQQLRAVVLVGELELGLHAVDDRLRQPADGQPCTSGANMKW